uniref:Uncharacterized protein n=1 Tax=Candidatus Kentrum sp. MB TaxID=2138164 RepID=A0A451B9G1_9GAMM|nr:MAG: hypothetical protein BECKMB1821G_GA0114241_100936 [Candidatus Kentron sp. MB]VFK27035.1 MAG: hypothetical protein BECKMB1821I_GA0114274_100216 [Candidatus Kentron sp. MB]VFK74928.1 MAG: hypothetical protein BECKMB1821H_GA0114242_101237 [Candidatus Kentron sp. MB]
MSKWIIWTKDSEDFRRWSNEADEFFVEITSRAAPSCYSGNVGELADDWALVINGSYKSDIDDFLPSEIDWYANARLWAHLGGVTGEPQEADWERFLGEVRKLSQSVTMAFGSIREKRAFGSTINTHVLDVARQVSETLGKKESAKSGEELLNALAKAWEAAQEQLLFGFDKRILEALFPLYVDLSNDDISSLTQADREAAWRAARSNLDIVWSSEQSPEAGSHFVTSELCSLLDGPITQGASNDFLKRFQKLSERYTQHLDPTRKLDTSTPSPHEVQP